MATFARNPHAPPAPGDRFFLVTAFAMTAVIVAGFSLQLAMGRSSFDSPPLVHAHAIVFMGWVGIYLLQNIFAATGNRRWHRRLGWVAVGWIGLMLVFGCLVTLAIVRRGQVPFFFQPVQFLVFDPVSVFTFAGLTGAAIALRRRTDWHRRLHFCGMAMLLGPGFGRLLPMPFLIPWAFEATFVATLIFPAIGVVADIRCSGRPHPAWGWAIGGMFASLLLVEAVSYGPAGRALYAAVTAGTPGAAVSPLAFPPPPVGPRRTGRS
ncbi:MAG: hypothetical protein ACOYLS_10470 [Polymorphobacter sp.]